MIEYQNDQELLAKFAREGSEDVFAELVRRHAGIVFFVAMRIVRSASSTEDVSQGV